MDGGRVLLDAGARALPRAAAARQGAHASCGPSARPTLDGQRLTDNQRALLERLPGPAGSDLAALRRLEGRGLVSIAPRARRRAPRTDPAADRVVELTPEQARRCDAPARGRLAPAARRHRLRQDRGLPARLRATRSTAAAA